MPKEENYQYLQNRIQKMFVWWDIYYFLMEKLSRIYTSLLFNLSYMFYRTSVKIITILFLELVHIVKVNPNTTYIHIHKQRTTVYCMVFFFVYLASYGMQLFATCCPEHVITTLRYIYVIVCGVLSQACTPVYSCSCGWTFTFTCTCTHIWEQTCQVTGMCPFSLREMRNCSPKG